MAKNLFIKGQSGNPKGKPKGVRHKTTQITYALMEGNLEEILAIVIERAKSGDMAACRMIVDKVLPNSKERPIAINLPVISNLDGVGRAQVEILQAVSVGDITPNEGERIASIVEARRRSIETINLETRICRLEGNK